MTTTETRTATDVVRAYFDALQQGQFDSIGALFADDVRWHQPGEGTPSGVYTSKAAVFDLFGKFMQLSRGTFAINRVDAIMANGDLVAATLQFHARRGSEQIDMRGVDVMRVRDGPIFSGVRPPDSASIVSGSPNRGKTSPANVTISVMTPSSIRSTSRARALHAVSPGRDR